MVHLPSPLPFVSHAIPIYKSAATPFVDQFKYHSNMNVQTLLENLDKVLTCSVCHCTFTDAKLLPCLHTFCLHCLNEILRTSGSRSTISCPECRRDIPVPESGNFNELPTDFRMNSLRDVRAIKECKENVKCGNCEQVNAPGQSFYCFECSSFWCKKCIVAHNTMKASKQHRSLALEDFKTEDFESVLKRPERPAFCQKRNHETEELKFFCRRCLVAMCSVCSSLDHEGHPKVHIEEAANERRMQFRSAIEEQKEKMIMKRSKITKIKEICSKMQEEVINTKQDVQGFVDNLVSVIEAKKRDIFSLMEEIMKESKQRLEKQKGELEVDFKKIEKEVAKTELLLKERTSAEIVRFEAIFQEAVRDNGDTMVDCDLERFPRLFFKGNELLMHILNTEGIGSFQTFLSRTESQQTTAEGEGITEAIYGLESGFVVTTRNSAGQQSYEKLDVVTLKVRNSQGHDSAVVSQIQDNKNGTYNITYFPKEIGTHEASVEVNGRHIDGSPFKVEVKTRQFSPLLSLAEHGSIPGMLIKPCGLAVNELNEIIVTDTGNNRVQILRGDGSYVREFGNAKKALIFPAGLALDRYGNIFVVDCNDHRVNKFNGQGKLLCKFGSRGSLDHQLNNPHGVSVDSDGNIMVADSGNKQVKIFSSTGQFVDKFGGEDLFVNPYDAVDNDKHIFVLDRGDHSIKVFSKVGCKSNYLYKIGGEGEGDGEFKEPWSLSFNNVGHLMVCDSDNHRIQLFEPDGKFLAKFGTKGKGKGEFKKPIKAAVLRDGKIIVSDFHNHTIQVFE